MSDLRLPDDCDPSCKRTTLSGRKCGAVDAHVSDCPALRDCPWGRCEGRFSRHPQPCAMCWERNRAFEERPR